MFNCAGCRQAIGPNVSPIMFPTQSRSREYTDSDGALIAVGYETVTEGAFCAECMKVPVVNTRTVIDAGLTHLTLGKAMQGHAVKCNRHYDDCQVCKKNAEVFASIPPQVLSAVLSNKQAQPVRISLASMVMEAAITRTMDRGKRATADVAAALPVLRAYEQRGGGL